MKKYTLWYALGLLMLAGLSSCFHHRSNDFSITFSDDDDEFEMEADYPRRKTDEVKVYLNDHLLNNISHRNGRRFKNEKITLDDNTTFYVDSYPGEIEIRVDKDENSEEGCERVRQMCKELKVIIEQK